MPRARILIAALALVGAGCSAHSPDPAGTPSASLSPTRAAETTMTPVSSAAASSTPIPSTPKPSPKKAVAPVPPVSAKAHAAGLVDVRSVVPDAIIDLRYATADNFVGERLYPSDARCLVHKSMKAGLTAAARELRKAGDVLVFWDCYRPHAVQVHMFKVVSDPNFVARPGPYARSHEAGRSVDVSVAHAAPGIDCPSSRRDDGHCLLSMGTGFDDFTARAAAFATAGVSAAARANRVRLRTAMAAGDLSVYSGEWWHFDGPGADTPRPYLDAPVD